jgi:hypothetical protein
MNGPARNKYNSFIINNLKSLIFPLVPGHVSTMTVRYLLRVYFVHYSAVLTL